MKKALPSPCLQRFFGCSIQQFTTTLNMPTGNDQNEVKSRIYFGVEPWWGVGMKHFSLHLPNSISHILFVLADQQKRDFSIAAGMQYSVGDKCKVGATEQVVIPLPTLPFFSHPRHHTLSLRVATFFWI